MDDALIRALEPVLRDIRATGAPMPQVRDDDWVQDPRLVSAMLWSRDGSGAGVNMERDLPAADGVARVADQVQEWVIEELRRQSATNWPACPLHPDTHPLTASTHGDVAVWKCPGHNATVCPIGSLR